MFECLYMYYCSSKILPLLNWKYDKTGRCLHTIISGYLLLLEVTISYIYLGQTSISFFLVLWMKKKILFFFCLI